MQIVKCSVCRSYAPIQYAPRNNMCPMCCSVGALYTTFLVSVN